jgi:hypothetical protein
MRIPKLERARLLSSLEVAESMIRGDVGRETLVAFKDGAGTFVRRASGNVIDISDVYLSLRGCVVTHNHPGGTSFSMADIATTMAGSFAEFRAVAPGLTYVAAQGSTPWTEENWADDIYWLYLRFVQDVNDEFVAAEDRGEQTREESEARAMHEVWTRIAQIGKLKYNRT